MTILQYVRNNTLHEDKIYTSVNTHCISDIGYTDGQTQGEVGEVTKHLPQDKVKLMLANGSTS